MKKTSILLIALLAALFFSCDQKTGDEKNEISIIPQPVKIEKRSGHFEINSKTQIVNPKHSNIQGVAKYLKDQLDRATGFDLSFGEPFEKENVIAFEFAAEEDLGVEGYHLDITPEKVTIFTNSTEGAFYGVQTLFQLLPAEIFSSKSVINVEWMVPCCVIYDKPRFSWRGMHLDVSRHFFPLEFVKRYIDLIALHKMNVFHWHLTDDNGWRIEIKKYPLLTDIAAWRVDREDMPWREVTPPEPGEKATYGGYYTQEEIREVIDYAAERQITVIPEIEMPGHTSEVFAAYPQLSCKGEKLYVQSGSYWPNTDIFCAGNEEVFTFIEDVLDEVMELFPAKYIHIGGDEATKQEWESCPKCQKRIKDEGLKNEHELQSYFIKRIEKYLNDHGKLLIGWDEILEGGLAPEATVMSWRGFEGGIEAAVQGHDVIMCPTSHCYFDYYQANPDFEPVAIGGFTSLKKVYSFEPVPEELNDVQAKHILGGQGNVWTEFIPTPEHAEYMAVPRMTALAEVLWSPKESRNWDSFQERYQCFNKRLDVLHVNYSQGSWNVDIHPSLIDGKYTFELSSEQYKVPIHFTLDGSEPTVQSPVYEKPFVVNESAIIKAGMFINGKLMEYATVKEIVLHKAVGKECYLSIPSSKKYPASGAISLVDGLRGSENYRDGYWIGFQGKNLDFEIDLGDEIDINRISASFFQNTGAWIFMPEKVTYAILDAEKNELITHVVYPESTMEVKGTIIEELTSEFENVKGRFVKVQAKNINTIPDWHEGAGGRAWIFADEVVIK